MRILSVVSLISPDGAYGGPMRVAVNQAAALTELGHHVTIAAGTRGYAQPPSQLEGVAAALFPARTVLPGTGFAGLASPGLHAWLRRNVTEFDVVHIHAARDLITLPAAAVARRARVPYVMQPHGMIDASTNPLAGPLDAALTRPLLRSAAAVFHLTDLERDQLREVAGDQRFQPLANGVPFAEPGPAAPAPEVLFLARLAPRKRPAAFVQAAQRLAGRYGQVPFVLVGPDEGEGARLEPLIAEARAAGATVSWAGAISPDQTLDRMRKAAIYVLPSVDEPYGMTVLEALSVGRPVVVTDTCGLAGFITEHRAGLVVDDSVDQLAEAVGELLANPIEAEAAGRRGREAVRRELSMIAIAEQLADHYAAAISV
jgi:glycosyltransferase involved in cell wall biosynthesis